MKKIDLKNGKKIETPFRVPEGYFDELTENIQSGIRDQPRGYSMIRKWWLSPVAAAAVIILGYIFFEPSISPSPERMLAEVPEHELLAYLDMTDASDLELAFVIQGQEDLITEGNTLPEELDLEGVDPEELLNYELTNEYLQQ